MIRNILWDVDGVLFDTHPAFTYAISKALNDLGLTLALNEIDGLTRQSVDNCLFTLSQRFKLDPDLLRLRFNESYLQVLPERQSPFPGVHDVCEYINRLGVNVIVTHRSMAFTQQMLTAHALMPYFTGIINTAEGYPPKPAHHLLQAALQKYSLGTHETLVIGSQDIDIQAGYAAGLTTCRFGNVAGSIQAHYQFNTFPQLLDWLKMQ